MLLRRTLCTWIALGTISLLGCGNRAVPPPHAANQHAGQIHQHDHASQGPHGGNIIELGTASLHAELVRDDQTGSVTIHFLDASVKQAAPIDAAEVSVNLRLDGKAQQFKLAALPAADDPQGKASRFVSEQQELADDLDRSGAHGQLVVMIDNKQYRGNIEHAHDHAHGEHRHP